MNKFSATESLTFGWETFKKRSGFLVGVTLLIGVVTWIVSAILGGHNFVFNVINFLVQTVITMGITAFFLKAHEDISKVEIADLWHPQSFVSFLVVSIITGVAVVVGLLLFIVPGLYAMTVLAFSRFIAIDRPNLGPIEALKESMRITEGKRWEVLALVLLVIVINIVGALLLLIGLLVTIPVTVLALTHAYRTLEHAASEIEIAPSATPPASV